MILFKVIKINNLVYIVTIILVMKLSSTGCKLVILIISHILNLNYS
jgi:hypothetical protein